MSAYAWTLYWTAVVSAYTGLPVAAVAPVSAPAVPSAIDVVFPARSPETSWTTRPRPADPAHVAVIVGLVPTMVVPPLPAASTA